MRSCYNDIKDFGVIKTSCVIIQIDNGITRNALSMVTGIRYDVIDRYYKEKVTRIDLENLARICYALECNLKDILDYEN